MRPVDLNKVRDYALRELEKHNAVMDALVNKDGKISAENIVVYTEHCADAHECKGIINTISMILDGQIRVGGYGVDSLSIRAFGAAGYTFTGDGGNV